MSAPPVVRRARAGEEAAASETLTDAFIDEDALNYWLRQGAGKERARRRFFDEAVATRVHPARELWVVEGESGPSAAAIWLAPGLKAFDFSFLQELALAPMLFGIAGIGGMAKGLALAEKLEHYHPAVPHAHLVFLGVKTSTQGQGLGSALLKATLTPLDASGTLAYLETSTARNVGLYQRHGFAVTGEFDLRGLHIWTMTRAPRA